MEVHEKLQDLRQRVLRGEEVPAKDYKEVIDDLREGRRATAATKAAKSASKVREVDPDDIFGV